MRRREVEVAETRTEERLSSRGSFPTASLLNLTVADRAEHTLPVTDTSKVVGGSERKALMQWLAVSWS